MVKPALACLLLATVLCAQKAHSNPTITFVEESTTDLPTTVVFVDDHEQLDGYVGELNEKSEGKIATLIELNNFTAEVNEVLHLQLVADKTHLLLVGSRQDQSFSSPKLQDLGGIIAAALQSTEKDVNATIVIDNLDTEESTPAAHVAHGYHLRDYFFDKYKAIKRGGYSTLEFVTLDAATAAAAESKYDDDLRYVAEGVHLARNLASEPGKSLYPVEFVARVKAQLKGLKNLKIRVLNVRDMEKLNMGALLGVGQGSIHEPRLLIVEYMGGEKDAPPIALAGKGVTFDTGGISLKPNANMWQMKS
ncbi:MAG: M17 family peptidase N-terminal domain-containing protein, partial [Pseudomonadota bacterium]